MSEYFALILVILTVASGIIALIDAIFFRPARVSAAKATKGYAKLTKKERYQLVKGPILADYGRSLFLIFLLVLVLRSFVFEPFKIPSGSMLPTLQIGDFLMVKKYAYEWKWPVWGGDIHTFSRPKRADVIVFKYPVNQSFDFIKRVVAIGGDDVSYVDHQLIINGHKMPQMLIKKMIDPNDSSTQPVEVYQEDLSGVKHLIYVEPWAQDPNFYHVKVPKGDVMVMGDNRNNSEDSRFWGFVPDHLIVGKAYRIWFSLNWTAHHFGVRWNRIGRLIQ